MVADTANLVSLVRQGAETSDEVKSEAFRIWIENGRSWRRTSEATGISDRTLRSWGHNDDWETRRRDQAAAFLPGMTTETAFALKLAAHNASLRMQQIAWEANELGVKPDTKEVQALSLIIDRGGYSPVGKNHPGFDPPPDPTTASPDFGAMSPDELRAYDESIRKTSKRQTAVATDRTRP